MVRGVTLSKTLLIYIDAHLMNSLDCGVRNIKFSVKFHFNFCFRLTFVIVYIRLQVHIFLSNCFIFPFKFIWTFRLSIPGHPLNVLYPLNLLPVSIGSLLLTFNWSFWISVTANFQKWQYDGMKHCLLWR